MTAKLSNWLDERLGWRGVWETVFLRKIPKVNWWYTLGSATLFVAVNQAVTGILLTIYYVPTPDHAYDSVQFITTEVTAGWLIRGLHHYGASAMVILSILHMIRVIVMGAYKYPREMTWFTGVGLLLVVVGFGFTGYLLPWEKGFLGYHGRHTYSRTAPAYWRSDIAYHTRRGRVIGRNPGALLWRPHLGLAGTASDAPGRPLVPDYPHWHQRHSQERGVENERI